MKSNERFNLKGRLKKPFGIEINPESPKLNHFIKAIFNSVQVKKSGYFYKKSIRGIALNSIANSFYKKSNFIGSEFTDYKELNISEISCKYKLVNVIHIPQKQNRVSIHKCFPKRINSLRSWYNRKPRIRTMKRKNKIYYLKILMPKNIDNLYISLFLVEAHLCSQKEYFILHLNLLKKCRYYLDYFERYLSDNVKHLVFKILRMQESNIVPGRVLFTTSLPAAISIMDEISNPEQWGTLILTTLAVYFVDWDKPIYEYKLCWNIICPYLTTISDIPESLRYASKSILISNKRRGSRRYHDNIQQDLINKYLYQNIRVESILSHDQIESVVLRLRNMIVRNIYNRDVLFVEVYIWIFLGKKYYQSEVLFSILPKDLYSLLDDCKNLVTKLLHICSKENQLSLSNV